LNRVKSENGLVRVTTVPISLKLLLTGQMSFMKNAGFDVTMISAIGDEIESVIEYEGVRHKVIPFTRKISPLKDFFCLVLLIKFFHSKKPDIVHTHTPKAGLLGMIAARICGVPIRIHTIAGLPLMTATGWKKLLLTFTEKITYWGSQHVLPNSHSMHDFIKDNMLCKKSKLDMIGYGSTNGIDLKRYSTHALNFERVREIKESINYEESICYLLAVGRVVRDKGIMELVNSFIHIQSMSFAKNIKLVILGPMEELRSEEVLPAKLLSEIKSNKDIIHIEWSDHVENYMEIADIFVHASHREGFPNVLLQAGAMNIPIVCSNIPGNIDVVQHKKTGLLFEMGDVDSLVEQLQFALNNRDLMSDSSRNLKRMIEIKYEKGYVHNSYLNFYNDKLSTLV